MKWGKANMKGERHPTRRAQKKARAANTGDTSTRTPNAKIKKAVHAPGIKRNARANAQASARAGVKAVRARKNSDDPKSAQNKAKPRIGPISVGEKIVPAERLPTRSTPLPVFALTGMIAK